MSTEATTQRESDDVSRDNHWKGPFAETDKYGSLTGAHYVICRGCGIEVVTSRADEAEHRPGCPHSGGDA